MKTNEWLLTVLAEEYPKWYHQALKAVGQPEAAKEILQQCACRLGQVRRASIDPAGIRPYIARTIHHVALCFRAVQWRAQLRGQPLTETPARATPLDALLASEQAAQRTWLAEQARQGLSVLPPQQERAVRGMYLSNQPMTLASLAQAEGFSLGTAHSRVQAGLHTLRRYVAQARLAAASARPSLPTRKSLCPPPTA